MSPQGHKEWPNSLESFTETAVRMGLVPTSVVLRAELVPATLDEAEKLGIAPGSPLFRLDRVRRLDDIPIAVDSSVVPADVVPDIELVDFSVGSLYESLARARLVLAHAETTIEAREADALLASSLGMQPGRPILVMRQTVRDDHERALLASTIQYAGDRYRLRTYFNRMNLAVERA
jgi:GntR family transcriptional regulator